MNKQPLVSIIIPTYNRRHTLPETIRSVREQTYPNWELLIVDDNSIDDTEQLIDGYSRQDRRIRYLQNSGRKGPAAARNTGIRYSSGEYLAFLDSDDQWYENHLSDSIKAMQEEQVKVCYALWHEHTPAGELRNILETGTEQTRLAEAVNAAQAIQHGNRVIFPARVFSEFTSLKTLHCCHINTMVMESEVIRKTGLLNEKLPVAEDTDFVFRVNYAYAFCLIRNYHFVYNQSADSLYNFANRKMADMEKLISDTILVRRLTFCGLAACRMWQYKKAFIRKAAEFNRRDECLKKCNKKKALKYFSLGFINKKCNRMLAFLFLIKSLFYDYNHEKIKLLINILLPFTFRQLEIHFSEHWLS